MSLPGHLLLQLILVYFLLESIANAFTDSFKNTPTPTVYYCGIVQRSFISSLFYFENVQFTVLINIYICHFELKVITPVQSSLSLPRPTSAYSLLSFSSLGFFLCASQTLDTFLNNIHATLHLNC